MNHAPDILKLIESVDENTPDGMLDEIDARVDAFRFGHDFETTAPGRYRLAGSYTRSRDALRDLELLNWRLEGVHYDTAGAVQVVYRRAPYFNTCVQAASVPLETWEMAVLYALVVITDYERNLPPEPEPPPPLTDDDEKTLAEFGI